MDKNFLFPGKSLGKTPWCVNGKVADCIAVLFGQGKLDELTTIEKGGQDLIPSAFFLFLDTGFRRYDNIYFVLVNPISHCAGKRFLT
jgi:hypothetical protein